LPARHSWPSHSHAAEQGDEVASVQLIELHLVPLPRPGLRTTGEDIELGTQSQRGERATAWLYPAMPYRDPSRFRSEASRKSIIFVSPPTRAWWIMAVPFRSLRNGDITKTLVYEFSSERGDKPPLRAQP
jgi:hypothetical protein